MSKSHYWPGGVTGCWFKMPITHRISMAHCINIQKIIIIKFPSIIINFPVRRGPRALANQPPGPGPGQCINDNISQESQDENILGCCETPHRAGTNDHKGSPSHPQSSISPRLQYQDDQPESGPSVLIIFTRPGPLTRCVSWSLAYIDWLAGWQQNLPDSTKTSATRKYLHTGSSWVMVWCKCIGQCWFYPCKANK